MFNDVDTLLDRQTPHVTMRKSQFAPRRNSKRFQNCLRMCRERDTNDDVTHWLHSPVQNRDWQNCVRNSPHHFHHHSLTVHSYCAVAATRTSNVTTDRKRNALENGVFVIRMNGSRTHTHEHWPCSTSLANRSVRQANNTKWLSVAHTHTDTHAVCAHRGT